MENATSLGDKIKNLRASHKMSQEELGDRIGVSRQAISKWESGVNYPDISNIICLCQVFDLSSDELLGLVPFDVKSKKAKDVEVAKPKKVWKIAVVAVVVILVVVSGIFLLKGNKTDFSIVSNLPKEYNKITLSTAEIDGLLEANQKKRAEEISTLMDSFIFVDELAEENYAEYQSFYHYKNYSPIANTELGFTCRINVEEILSRTNTDGSLGYNEVPFLISSYLEDNFDESGALVVFSADFKEDYYFACNYFKTDKGYVVVALNDVETSRESVATKITDKDVQVLEGNTLSEIVGTISKNGLKSMKNISAIIKVESGENFEWGTVLKRNYKRGGEVLFATTQSMFKNPIEGVGALSASDYVVELNRIKSEVNSIEDVFSLINESNVQTSYLRQNTYDKDGFKCIYSSCPITTLTQYEGDEMSLAVTAFCLLEDDFDDVGFITTRTTNGNLNTFNYVFENGKYCFFNLFQAVMNESPSTEKNIFEGKSLKDVEQFLPLMLGGQLGENEDIISFNSTFDGYIIAGSANGDNILMPVGLDYKVIKGGKNGKSPIVEMPFDESLCYHFDYDLTMQ